MAPQKPSRSQLLGFLLVLIVMLVPRSTPIAIFTFAFLHANGYYWSNIPTWDGLIWLLSPSRQMITALFYRTFFCILNKSL